MFRFLLLCRMLGQNAPKPVVVISPDEVLYKEKPDRNRRNAFLKSAICEHHNTVLIQHTQSIGHIIDGNVHLHILPPCEKVCFRAILIFNLSGPARSEHVGAPARLGRKRRRSYNVYSFVCVTSLKYPLKQRPLCLHQKLTRRRARRQTLSLRTPCSVGPGQRRPPARRRWRRRQGSAPGRATPAAHRRRRRRRAHAPEGMRQWWRRRWPARRPARRRRRRRAADCRSGPSWTRSGRTQHMNERRTMINVLIQPACSTHDARCAFA
jgi:hypothetical protein